MSRDRFVADHVQRREWGVAEHAYAWAIEPPELVILVSGRYAGKSGVLVGELNTRPGRNGGGVAVVKLLSGRIVRTRSVRSSER